MVTVDQRSEPLRELLARLGPGGGDPRLAGLVTMLLEYDPADPAAFPPRLEQLAGDPDRHVALPALPVARPRARERGRARGGRRGGRGARWRSSAQRRGAVDRRRSSTPTSPT